LGYRFQTFSKLNLSLRVFPPRESDGYHPILSVFQSVSLCDFMDISWVDGPCEMRWACTHPLLQHKEENLLFKIFSAIRSQLNQGISISLEKYIPLGAGLGGASGNAAAFLLFLRDHFGWTEEYLHSFSLQFGSDIPFFLVGGIAEVSGVGEVVKPLVALNERTYLLINPGFGVSTPDAYRWFDQYSSKKVFVENDLQSAVFAQVPKLALLFSQLVDMGLERVQMSGSGATFFSYFHTQDEAKYWQDRIRNAFPDLWLQLAEPVTQGVRRLA